MFFKNGDKAYMLIGGKSTKVTVISGFLGAGYEYNGNLFVVTGHETIEELSKFLSKTPIKTFTRKQRKALKGY